MKRFLCVLLVLWFGSVGVAEAYSTLTRYQICGGNCANYRFSTAEACSAAVKKWYARTDGYMSGSNCYYGSGIFAGSVYSSTGSCTGPGFTYNAGWEWGDASVTCQASQPANTVCVPFNGACVYLSACTAPQTRATTYPFACTTPPCPTGANSGSVRYSGTTLPATFCQGGCTYSVVGVSAGIPDGSGFTWSTTGTTTGAQCTGGDTVTAGDPVGDVDGCVTDSHGRVVCPSTTPDCITVNGNEVCDVNGQQCEVVNGKISCAGGQPLDPDTVACWQDSTGLVCAGSTGQTSSSTDTVVNPDGTTTKTTTTTSNVAGTGTRTTITVYDSGGNIISSSTTLTGGSDPGGSGTGTGQEGDVAGTGDGDGAEDTDEESFSGGELGTGAALDLTGKDKAAAQSKIDSGWAAVKAAPIVAALSVNAGSVPVSACPTLAMTLPLGIGNISTDLHCTVWEAVKGVLSVVSLAAWAILGIIIIASA